jgi:predicted RNase H-like HicB family nuclease
MRNLHYTLYREESDYVAQCLDYDVSSFGSTEKEALANLKEALELYLEDLPESTTIPQITEVTINCKSDFLIESDLRPEADFIFHSPSIA